MTNTITKYKIKLIENSSAIASELQPPSLVNYLFIIVNAQNS
ncbi:hypothetical protein VV11_006155 [Trichodesmium erythraeum 21-75]|nr:hypothetical protein [Trichodesmium erythraeum 21-75]